MKNENNSTKSVLFGARVKARRNQLGLTLKEFAVKIGMSTGGASYCGRIENGEVKPTLNRALDIANALGVSMAWLLGEVNDENADEALAEQYKGDNFLNFLLTTHVFPNGMTYMEMESKLKKLEALEKMIKG